MKILIMTVKGLDEKEERELSSLIQGWNRKRKSQNKEKIEYVIKNEKKIRYSVGARPPLHRGNFKISDQCEVRSVCTQSQRY